MYKYNLTYISLIIIVVSLLIAFLSSWALGKYDDKQETLEYKFAIAGTAIAQVAIIGGIGLLVYHQIYGKTISSSGSSGSSSSSSSSGLGNLFKL
jgi:hypothetical protein